MNIHPIKALFAVTTVAAIFNPASAQTYVDTVLADHPEAYWRLGESNVSSPVFDSSGHGLNATYSSDVVLGQSGAINGDSNTSAYFPAASGGTSILTHITATGPFTNTLEPVCDSWTVEAWIKAPSSNTAGSIVSWHGYSNAYYSLTTDGNGLVWWNFGDNPAGHSFQLNSSNLRDNQWHHVVGELQRSDVYPWGAARLFVDGTLINELTPVAMQYTDDQVTDPPTSVPVYVGSGFGGQVDEVAIYRSALSDAQVLSHYEAGVSGVPEPSAYAALAGLAALALAVVRRRV